MVVPRWIRAHANRLALALWPDAGDRAARRNIRRDIRDAYIQGWIDGHTDDNQLRAQLARENHGKIR